MPRTPWQHVPPTAETLRHPPREYGILPFWFLNGELDPEEMRWQLRELREKEMPGIILHGRFGLELPYLGPEFRDRVRLAVEEGERLGLTTWIYDEMNWPSGTANWRVVEERPDLTQRYLECLSFPIRGPWFAYLTGGDSRYIDFERSTPVAAFGLGEDGQVIDLTPYLSFENVIPWEAPPGTWRIMYVVEKRADYYIDALNPEATAEFLRLGYEPYAETVGDKMPLPADRLLLRRLLPADPRLVPCPQRPLHGTPPLRRVAAPDGARRREPLSALPPPGRRWRRSPLPDHRQPGPAGRARRHQARLLRRSSAGERTAPLRVVRWHLHGHHDAADEVDHRLRVRLQAHASMAPPCAVANVRPEGATVYSSSQNVYGLRASLAPILGLAEAQVRVIYKEGSGCYGHNGADDVSADAAVLSQAVGRPVCVQWGRVDDFGWEPKGPAMVSRVRGGLDAEGNVIAWDYDVWTPTHSTRPNGEPARLLAGELVDPLALPASFGRVGGDRNAANTYSFPNNRVTAHWIATPPLRPGSLRSLGGMANTTANEGFLDELAVAAGADPVEFRLRHLFDPRAIDVIRRAAEVAGWEARVSGPGAPGRTRESSGGRLWAGRGIAFARYETEYAYAAVVAEVTVDPSSGDVRVQRVVVAHDCGLIVNPDGLTNQIEGNVIQGVSRALKEEVTFDQVRVTSLDWSTYRILTFEEIPRIEVALINQPEEPSWGAGEPAICPTAAAIGNAIFDATGARLRTVPFTPDRVLAAL